MGAYAGDYDGDGWMDIVKTNFPDDTSTLYHNNGDGTFTDATAQGGLGANTQFLGWGTLFLDIDNDGWPDLFIANGHVYPDCGRDTDSSVQFRNVRYPNISSGGLLPIVSVMQPAHPHRKDDPCRNRRPGCHGPLCRGVLFETVVRAVGVVIGEMFFCESEQVSFSEDDDVIWKFAAVSDPPELRAFGDPQPPGGSGT